MKSTLYIVFLFIIYVNALFAQVPETEKDTIPPVIETLITPDIQTDTIIKDTLRVRIADDPIDREIIYSARDSSDVNNKEKRLYLWGEARVEYDNYIIEADVIIMDLEEDIAIAEAREGEQYAGVVKFNDGEQDMTALRLRYNFKTKKGHMRTIRTAQGDLYVLSESMKFVSAEDDEYRDDAAYGYDAIFTTCDAPKPHYGIRSNRQKIVPNKVVVVGVSNLEIAEVPTPLVLPFGFFPITKGAKKGLIFPSGYETSPTWGFGLRDVGYYIPINDKMDASIMFDIYLRGTFMIKLSSRYNVRYRYSGNYNIQWGARISENLETGLPDWQRSFELRWSHNQDPKAHPYQTFSGNVQFQTNNHQSLNYNNAQSVLQNSISSNISYRRTFPDRPFTLAASLQHSQNTGTRQVIVSFPNVDFQMQRIFPFKSKSRRGGQPKWYEEISLTYNSKMQNRFTGVDSTFFTQQTIDDARFGIQQNAAVNTNLRIFKYISVVPNIDLREVWQFSTVNKTFDPTLILNPRDTIIIPETMDTIPVYDTLFGRIVEERVRGFRAFRQYNVSVSMNTQLFGTMQFKKGMIRGVRHVIKPTVSFRYSPDYTNPNLDYVRSVRRNLLSMDSVFYSVFETNIFGAPPNQGKQMAISYNITNIFEAKYRFRKDSMDRKLKLFDNIFIAGDYNFAADSLKFSQIRFNGTHRIFKGMTTLQMSLVLDPYERIGTRRINTFAWTARRKLVNFVNWSTNINTSLSMGTIRGWVDSSSREEETDPGADRVREHVGPQSFWDWVDNFSINHTLVMGIANMDGENKFMVGTNNIQMFGNIPLTPKWSVNLGSIGYDFNQKRMTYPDVGFQRDLHCWEMGMDWQPTRGTYRFFIRVKPSSLDFINIPYMKNNADGLSRRF